MKFFFRLMAGSFVSFSLDITRHWFSSSYLPRSKRNKGGGGNILGNGIRTGLLKLTGPDIFFVRTMCHPLKGVLFRVSKCPSNSTFESQSKTTRMRLEHCFRNNRILLHPIVLLTAREMGKCYLLCFLINEVGVSTE